MEISDLLASFLSVSLVPVTSLVTVTLCVCYWHSADSPPCRGPPVSQGITSLRTRSHRGVGCHFQHPLHPAAHSPLQPRPHPIPAGTSVVGASLNLPPHVLIANLESLFRSAIWCVIL